MRVKVLVLPVFRRHWLYHGFSVVEAASAKTEISNTSWWQRPSVQEKVTALTLSVNRKVNDFTAGQWAAMQAAKEGTFRNWMFKLASGVLSREDPIESFLKQLPGKAATRGDTIAVEVMYPAGLDGALVRRRLRHVALRNTTNHKRYMFAWWLTCIPQLPLMIYRALSHQRALAGASMLESAFENPRSRMLQKALEGEDASSARSLKLAGRHHRGREGSARARTAQADNARLEELLHKLGMHTAHSTLGPSPSSDNASAQGTPPVRDTTPLIVFIPSLTLDEVTQPLERWRTPLDDSVASLLPVHRCTDSSWPGAQKTGFSISAFVEHLARARRHAVEREAARDSQRAAK